ncbi:hypothetical protein [Ralstonia solanacearum]|uniref:hypothetical protein n=1 Tax=Ralstonia solanacearum TaxID=305 RepID=UPI0013C2C784|nr:hypothetical protein [Ralstonia solanacearum]
MIEQIAELEWRRFQARMVDIVLGSGEIHHEDHSKFPPFTSVRFKNESPEFIAKLKSAVESYKGEIEWHMFGHQRLTLPGTNWIIRPIFVDQLIDKVSDPEVKNWGGYIAEHYPDFSAIAYADLLGLADHVRRALVG